MHMWKDYGLTDRLLTSEISAGYRNRIHRDLGGRTDWWRSKERKGE